MRNTAAEFEFGRRTNDMVGSHGVFGGELILETWQIIDDPSPRFRLGISEGKKSPVKSVKIDIHRRTAVLGSLRHGARYHISCVCQQTYLPSRHRWTLYSNLQMVSLW